MVHSAPSAANAMVKARWRTRDSLNAKSATGREKLRLNARDAAVTEPSNVKLAVEQENYGTQRDSPNSRFR
jgi:hypothetical protein